MKRSLVWFTLLPTVLFFVGCGQGNQEGPATITAQPAPIAETPSAPEAKAVGIAGTVTETMDAAGYSYVQIDTGSEKVWAAAPAVQVKVGDQVTIPDGMPMRNYHSKTLDRDFEVVYFVSSILDATGAPLAKGTAMPAGHPATGASSPPAATAVSGVEKAEGGKTVEEVFAEKADLSGKEVTLRGKVVKYNQGIMGKNWLHVQDGSGDAAAGTNDLTVTTDASAKIGDTVLVSGPVTLDKDFGYGYKYEVLIEDAKVTVE